MTAILWDALFFGLGMGAGVCLTLILQARALPHDVLPW